MTKKKSEASPSPPGCRGGEGSLLRRLFSPLLQCSLSRVSLRLCVQQITVAWRGEASHEVSCVAKLFGSSRIMGTSR
jgi:hypothetical protein